MSPSVAIVGAGMGGLASAVALSGRSGWEVTVLEADSDPGGKVGIQAHDGVTFGTGPSLLTLPSLIRELFDDRGVELTSELTLFEPDPTTRYDFRDGASFDVCPSLEKTAKNIGREFGPEVADEFRQFTDYAQKIWEAAAPHFIFGPAPTAITAVKLGLSAMKDLMAIDSTNTMLDAVDDRISAPHLRDLFLRYATFNGSDPRVAPATLHCIGWVDLGLGGFGVEGGMYELIRAFERVAKRGGVRFVYDTPVEAIRRRGQGFRLHFHDGSQDADAVVVNADVRHLVEHLWTGDTDTGLSVDSRSSMSGWTGVIKARRRPTQHRPAHRVVFPDRDYLREFVDLFDRGVPPEDPMIYLSATEKAHRTDGWTDHEPLFVMTNAPPLDESDGPVDWSAHKDRVMNRLRKQGLIDSDDKIVWSRTPRQLAERFPGSNGSIYGAASNSRWAAFKRPPNRVPDVEGLYLASGTAHPGGGLPLCVQSGCQAVDQLLEDFP